MTKSHGRGWSQFYFSLKQINNPNFYFSANEKNKPKIHFAGKNHFILQVTEEKAG